MLAVALTTHRMGGVTAILSKFIHDEVPALWWVVMTAPVVAELVASDSYHLGQHHLLPSIVVGAEACVEDDGARGVEIKVMKL